MTFSQAYQLVQESIQPLYGKEEANAITDLLFREQYKGNAFLRFNNEPFEHVAELEATIARLKAGEPIQYILGHAYFLGMKLTVDRHVLIPRPETEELVELAKTYVRKPNAVIADICTGSGCIALAMRKLFPAGHIIATDISEEALAVAGVNELLNFNQPAIQFRQHDILSRQWPFERPDLVLCNPPYIAAEEACSMADNVLKYEPHLALFVNDTDTLLFYKAVVLTFLNGPFPVLCFEMNPLHTQTFADWCALQGLDCEIVKDMQDKQRFTVISKS